jgi:dTDP-4-dehydrorhamnose 3,5-epimerase
MQITPKAFAEVLELVPKRVADSRSHICETWNSRTLTSAGIEHNFCQDNASFSAIIAPQ